MDRFEGEELEQLLLNSFDSGHMYHLPQDDARQLGRLANELIEGV
jgi:hypothetical protein